MANKNKTTLSWHSVPVETCINKLDTTLNGLSFSEVKKRLNEYGQNEISFGKRKNILKKLLNQLNNSLIYILIIAAIITSLLQHWVDASVIIAVIIINALIGYIQEEKAEKAIEALQKTLSLQANVIRESKRTKINAHELVPGDIVILNAGNKVPADLRLLKAHNLQIDESILTGESLPVSKSTQPTKKKAPLTEHHSMAYSGTYTTYGQGLGLVIATGKNTEVGRISAMLKSAPQFSTPLLRQLKYFGRTVSIIIVIFSLLAFLFGMIVRSYPFQEMFMAAVAIAVALIPEGLPAIITITLTIGVTRMARRKAIIRRLASVETLSSVSVICTDKTGTLTKNELAVQTIMLSHEQFTVTGTGYNDQGNLLKNQKIIQIEKHPDLLLLLRAGLLCNEAELRKENETWHLVGSPIEGALLAVGLKANLKPKSELELYLRQDSIPFDSRHKYMATLHHDQQNNSYIFVKGAPEKILALCCYQLQSQDQVKLDKDYWQTQIRKAATQGMRLLAIAYRRIPHRITQLSSNIFENKLTFIGIFEIIDPPRETVCSAVHKCQQAGIEVKMITGDHPLTAQAIGQNIGLIGKKILIGENIDIMSDEKLTELIKEVDIFARAIPEHKIRIIKALQKNHHIVAMTGDGVNDAPALKNADIGIAMGIKGTDVAKEASEIVLADDNFASIQYAVEEGRNVYNNLKKAILFVLPTSCAEGLLIFIAILFGYTLPITPLQVLWVNLITAVTLGLALAFEVPEGDLMSKKPRNPNEALLSKFLLWRIVFVSTLFVCCMFALFIYEINQHLEITTVRTIVVDSLVFLEACYLISCRRIYDSTLSKEGILGSKPVLIAILLVVIFQLGFTYLPFMNYLFNTNSLNLQQWMVLVAISFFIYLVIEFEKNIIRKFVRL